MLYEEDDSVSLRRAGRGIRRLAMLSDDSFGAAKTGGGGHTRALTSDKDVDAQDINTVVLIV